MKITKLALVTLFFLSFLSVFTTVSAHGDETPQKKDPSKSAQLYQEINTFNRKIEIDASDSLRVQELRSALKDRKDVMLNLAEENPTLFLNLGLPSATRQKISPSLQADLESNVSLTGIIEEVHVDDFKNPENSYFNYYLRVGSERLALHTTSPVYSQSGAKVRVEGVKLGSTVVALSSNISFLMSPPPDSVGEQKTLVLLINFLDSLPNTKTAEEVHDLTFNGQFQNFYKEQSYNKTWFTGDVYGWFTLPRNDNCMFVEYPFANNEVASIIKENNIDLANYDRLVLAVSGVCSGGGQGTVGKIQVMVGENTYPVSVAWVGAAPYTFDSQWASWASFPWTVWDFVLSHEIGHNLGVMHANSWDCEDSIMYGNCTHSEYGNFFDVMGYGFFGQHFNALYKELLGWIEPSETLTITNSGDYTIGLLNSNISNSDKKFAKIKMLQYDLTPFYLEFRKGLGFDNTLNDPEFSSNQQGVFVNHAILPAPGWLPFPFPRLLDMTPGDGYWWDGDGEHMTLNSDTPNFIDEGRGINIGPITNVASSTITFHVSIQPPECIRGLPSLLNSWAFPHAIAGGDGLGFVVFGNSDSISCGESLFDIKTNLPTSWQPTLDPVEPIPIIAGDGISQQFSKYVEFKVPIDAKVGDHSYTITISNLNSGLKKDVPLSVKILPPPIIKKVKPVRGPVMEYVELLVSGFSNDDEIFLGWLNFHNAIGNHFTYVYPANGSKISFLIPNFIKAYDCVDGTDCMKPVLPGTYDIDIAVNGATTNTVQFEVIDSLSDTANNAKGSFLNPFILFANVLSAIGAVFGM